MDYGQLFIVYGPVANPCKYVLSVLSTHCNFEGFLERALRDRFVCGLRKGGRGNSGHGVISDTRVLFRCRTVGSPMVRSREFICTMTSTSAVESGLKTTTW